MSQELDYKCSDCGVGIDHGKEKFNSKKTKVYCVACMVDRDRDGSTLMECILGCLEKINERMKYRSGIDIYAPGPIDEDVEELKKLISLRKW